MPLVPELRRQRKMDLCEFQDSLVYRGSSRTARATKRNPVLGGGGGRHSQKIFGEIAHVIGGLDLEADVFYCLGLRC